MFASGWLEIEKKGATCKCTLVDKLELYLDACLHVLNDFRCL